MQLRRFVGLVDLGIATVVVVALLLPAREMFATPVIKGDDHTQFAIALAEARTIARPSDGLATEAFARALGEAGMKDWAIESAVRAGNGDRAAPTRWRALLAASVAYVDRLDVAPALEYANLALAACDAARDRGETDACPSWEEVRVQLYQQHLDAGVKSGIDPHRDPIGFRKAGESALREIHLGGHEPPHVRAPDTQRGSDTGSGSAGGAGSPSGQ